MQKLGPNTIFHQISGLLGALLNKWDEIGEAGQEYAFQVAVAWTVFKLTADSDGVK